MIVKSINTYYNGHYFRSRLEARWAMALDLMGVKWLYEHEGFNIDGAGYLPDFYLPDFDFWIEVKGCKPTVEEINKCHAVANHTMKPFILLYGKMYDTHELTGYSENKIAIYGHASNLSMIGEKGKITPYPSDFTYGEGLQMASLAEDHLSDKGIKAVFDGSSKSYEDVIKKDCDYQISTYGKLLHHYAKYLHIHTEIIQFCCILNVDAETYRNSLIKAQCYRF